MRDARDSHNAVDGFQKGESVKTPTLRSLIGPVALALLMMLATMGALTATPARSATPLSGSARAAIEKFLADQTAGLPGKVGITIDTPMSGALPPCEALEPFLPGSTRLWGRVSIGVRCNTNQPWTRYVPAYIAVMGSYYVAARPINAGQALTFADAAVREGDLTTLPGSVVVNPDQLNGMIASNRIASGAPLRRELLRGAALVQQGQNIKVVTQGAGFVASAEGRAMTDAAVGAIVQVKIQGGPLLSGVVRPDGTVERPN